MRKSEKYIVLPITFIILCGIAYFVYYQWRLMEINAYHSCIGSVANAIQKSEGKKKLVLSDDWKILNSEEIDLLMSQIQAGDCSNFDNPTLDIWNHRVNIALRKQEIYPEIIVWSNGQDGISGTEDDLVIPFGQKIPK